MLLDKLSFIDRTKLRIAQSVTPIKQAALISFEQVDFKLSYPKTNAVRLLFQNLQDNAHDFSNGARKRQMSKTRFEKNNNTITIKKE